jgi:hypothetical protein
VNHQRIGPYTIDRYIKENCKDGLLNYGYPTIAIATVLFGNDEHSGR